MYEDAIKTSGHEGEIELRELTELVLECARPRRRHRRGRGARRRRCLRERGCSSVIARPGVRARRASSHHVRRSRVGANRDEESAAVSKETAFYPRLREMTDEWMDLFGYWAPSVVSDTLEEYRACREAAALMDFTMLRKVDIDGPGAQAFVNTIVTRDVSKLGAWPDRLRGALRRARQDGRRLHGDGALARQHPLLRRERPRLRDLPRAGTGGHHRDASSRTRCRTSACRGRRAARCCRRSPEPDLSNAALPVLHIPRGRRDRGDARLHDAPRLHRRARLRAVGRARPCARAVGRARRGARRRRG